MCASFLLADEFTSLLSAHPLFFIQGKLFSSPQVYFISRVPSAWSFLPQLWCQDLQPRTISHLLCPQYGEGREGDAVLGLDLWLTVHSALWRLILFSSRTVHLHPRFPPAGVAHLFLSLKWTLFIFLLLISIYVTFISAFLIFKALLWSPVRSIFIVILFYLLLWTCVIKVFYPISSWFLRFKCFKLNPFQSPYCGTLNITAVK